MSPGHPGLAIPLNPLRKMKKEKLNCYKCTHYFITWDNKFPRGCKAMHFKSRQMPSALVLKSSGAQCLKFRPKRKEGKITLREQKD